jgi:Protein of unknown function (DUF3276)
LKIETNSYFCNKTKFFQLKLDTVENERDAKRFESVYSKKVRAGKRRTYFFDVRRTRGEDFYLTLTESTKRMQGGYERHKIFLYKEDFNRFLQSLEETVNYIKTELMPQYDYDEFARRQDEYEARIAAENEGKSEESDDDTEGGNEPVVSQKAEVYAAPVEVKPTVVTTVTTVTTNHAFNDPELRALEEEEQVIVKSEPTVANITPTVEPIKPERTGKLDEDEDMSW